MATRLIRLLNIHVVIIVQTAFEKPGDYQRAIDAVCNKYITKPLNLMRLNELTKKHFKLLKFNSVSGFVK